MKLTRREMHFEVRSFGPPIRFQIEGWEELRQARPGPAEGKVIKRMVAHLRPEDVVYDVGANIGFVGLVLSRHLSGLRARVHSFEPEPRNFESLCRNIRLNELEDRVIPHRLALGPTEGEVELFVRGGAGEGRHSTLARKGSTGSIQVPMTTLTLIAGSLEHCPDVLKIDVEGGEGRVLAGMDGLLKDERPRELFLEIHPKGEGDRMPSGEPIQEWLGDRGFQLVWEGREGSRRHQHYR